MERVTATLEWTIGSPSWISQAGVGLIADEMETVHSPLRTVHAAAAINRWKLAMNQSPLETVHAGSLIAPDGMATSHSTTAISTGGRRTVQILPVIAHRRSAIVHSLSVERDGSARTGQRRSCKDRFVLAFSSGNHPMDANGYEQCRRALEKQYQEDLELVHAAYQAKLRALEMLRSSSAGEEGAGRTEPVAVATPKASRRGEARQQESAPRLPPGGLREAVEAVLPQLPEVFDRQAVETALGFVPKRTTLVRILKDLWRDGVLWPEQLSDGGKRTKYRKITVR